MQETVAALFEDTKWIENHLISLRATLAQRFLRISELCESIGIDVYPSSAGFFAWFDLRAALESDTFEAEAQLQEELLSHKARLLFLLSREGIL